MNLSVTVSNYGNGEVRFCGLELNGGVEWLVGAELECGVRFWLWW